MGGQTLLIFCKLRMPWGEKHKGPRQRHQLFPLGKWKAFAPEDIRLQTHARPGACTTCQISFRSLVVSWCRMGPAINTPTGGSLAAVRLAQSTQKCTPLKGISDKPSNKWTGMSAYTSPFSPLPVGQSTRAKVRAQEGNSPDSLLRFPSVWSVMQEGGRVVTSQR